MMGLGRNIYKRLISSKVEEARIVRLREKGLQFEERVARMMANKMEVNIKRNVILKDKHGNNSEIDIVYGRIFKTYVECKDYTVPVPLKDVAKFKEVLELNGISKRNGLFITSGVYVPRATTTGIKTWDGEKLERMELFAPVIGITKFICYFGITVSLFIYDILYCNWPYSKYPAPKKYFFF